ncbi:hypothetical protein HKM21_27890 [Longimicrobium terrae]|uniref:Uncharacterized protein n=2 Tax=Longimicrobium terrae TaxID=1639882 RepID=A0A841GRF3_9BACT|nr:hypothetical protein [Longimicrobium terrae]MBB6070182.1 hypothetical protein [Longimicrobium terrae]NNC33083.1 hypothetical protein [Longimicrobium terrae]
MALTRKISRAMQRQVDLTTAVCQERLLSTHVRHVLALVDLVHDELPFDSALDIYARILRLTPEQARNVGSRALAAIGRRTGLTEAEELNLDLSDDESDLPDETRAQGDDSGRFDAVFSRVRRRIKGRVQDDLRQRINLASARAEDALFETHVQNALVFGKALAEEVPLHEAVDLYLDVMTIPEGVSDVIFNRALRIVADDVLPGLDASRVPRREADGRTAPASVNASASAR